MGAIEDTRKVLQDFLAPELRALSVRLDALEKRLESLDDKVDANERRAERRHDEVMGAIRQVLDLNSIQQRLARLEAKAGSPQ
jgi:cell division septum initiation protein DivIVA